MTWIDHYSYLATYWPSLIAPLILKFKPRSFRSPTVVAVAGPEQPHTPTPLAHRLRHAVNASTPARSSSSPPPPPIVHFQLLPLQPLASPGSSQQDSGAIFFHITSCSNKWFVLQTLSTAHVTRMAPRAVPRTTSPPRRLQRPSLAKAWGVCATVPGRLTAPTRTPCDDPDDIGLRRHRPPTTPTTTASDDTDDDGLRRHRRRRPPTTPTTTASDDTDDDGLL
ncbi:hypothetical protein BC826DRAFT_1113974 [Russula brevipes]|nr:hypothetical protein BC826DRAFT_1113974 [Russula brevipes]